MVLYYALKPNGNQIHVRFAIKKAYDSNMPNNEYIDMCGCAVEYRDFVDLMLKNGAVTLKNLNGTEDIFEFIFVNKPVPNLVILAGTKGIKLVMKDDIWNNQMTTQINPNLPVIYYDYDYDDGIYEIYIALKKYEDLNIATLDAVYDEHKCNDYDASIGMSSEFAKIANIMEPIVSDGLFDDGDYFSAYVNDLSKLIACLSKKGYSCIKKDLI